MLLVYSEIQTAKIDVPLDLSQLYENLILTLNKKYLKSTTKFKKKLIFFFLPPPLWVIKIPNADCPTLERCLLYTDSLLPFFLEVSGWPGIYKKDDSKNIKLLNTIQQGSCFIPYWQKKNASLFQSPNKTTFKSTLKWCTQHLVDIVTALLLNSFRF